MIRIWQWFSVWQIKAVLRDRQQVCVMLGSSLVVLTIPQGFTQSYTSGVRFIIHLLAVHQSAYSTPDRVVHSIAAEKSWLD